MNLVWAALIGYAIGSIPMGYIAVRLVSGKNILEFGSGRTGGTNAYRAAGPLALVLTVVVDFLKGAVAMVIVFDLYNEGLAVAIAGIAAILGHNVSIYMWFMTKRLIGGVGAATFGGGAVYLWPPMAPFFIVITFIVTVVTGYSSVTSTSVVLFTLAVFGLRALQGLGDWYSVLYAFGGGILILYALRPNYKRLREGTERMVGPRKRRAEKKSTEQSLKT